MLFEPRKRFLLLSAILIALTTLLLLSGTSSALTETYKEGQVLNRAIVSPADITTVDIADTEQKKAAAKKVAHAVFNFDSSRAETSVQSFRAAWDDLKKQYASESASLPGMARAVTQ
jgi:membrane-associated HD superfamily phosphohydrolase